jgi:hypothetical protein
MDSSDKHLLNLKFNTYMTKYEYLKMELTETTYLFELYKKKFFEECCANNTSSEPENIHDEHSIPESTTEEEQNAVLENDYDKYMKKLYRLLSLKTHPDKNQNNETDETSHIFLEIQNAYIQKDILRLISLARQLNIQHKFEDILKLHSNTLNVDQLFQKSIESICEKIHNLKCTLAWNWQIADDNAKNDLCQRYNLRRF